MNVDVSIGTLKESNEMHNTMSLTLREPSKSHTRARALYIYTKKCYFGGEHFLK
jgi:hypothetical protein